MKSSPHNHFFKLLLTFFILCSWPSYTLANSENYKIVSLLENLDHPWAISFLPNHQILITEKPGKLLKFDLNTLKAIEIFGLPKNLVHRRQGGLLDIIVDPDFKTNRTVYISYVGRGMGGTGTEVLKAELRDNTLVNKKVIFKAQPKIRSDVHFGSRLLFTGDNKLLITLGERFKMKEAQKPQNHLGSIIRINPDGSIPEDNPIIKNALPDTYSYGHRNVQGVALNPFTGEIWSHEHGPKGGDELNIIRPGVNYGWPIITYGIDYDGSVISAKTHEIGMEQPITYWTPSIAPCGMAFYKGEAFPEWNGDLFMGALAGQHLRQIKIENNQVISEITHLLSLKERIRDVRVGPDGFLYLITDSPRGKLIRLEPSLHRQ
jgi:glucose/arabinose dehydrogenase